MKIFLLFVSYSVFLPQIFGNSIIEAFTCTQTQNTECLFNNVIIEDSGIFLPKSRADREVTKVTFKLSIVPTLTSVICDKFSNLQTLDVRMSSMHQILEGALNGCTKLREIYLQDNWLKELPGNLFHTNPMLEKIYLNNNNLTEIPLELFNGLSSLKRIDLCVNRLLRLPAELFVGLNSVESLEVMSNPLLSLDIEQMVIEMPKLKYVYFQDLDIPCTRMVQIEAFMVKNSMYKYLIAGYSTVHTKAESYNRRQRIYVPGTATSFMCINEEQHQREVYIKETLPTILKNLNPIQSN